MNGSLRSLLVAGTPRRLAINGDHVARHPGLGRNPGDEAFLKLLRVQCREDVAGPSLRWVENGMKKRHDFRVL